MLAPRIRTLAVAVPRLGGGDAARVLVERGHDRVKRLDFYRAIGGGVEFGEHAAEACAREWQEEYAITLEGLALRGVLENLFTYEGRPGHEIVFVFDATIAERWPRERDGFETTEAHGRRHAAVWVPVATLGDDPVPLYPHGLADLLGAG